MQQRAQRSIPIDTTQIEDGRIDWSNYMLLQTSDEGFILSFCQLMAPIHLNGQPTPKVTNMRAVARPIARIAVRPEKLLELKQLIEGHLERMQTE